MSRWARGGLRADFADITLSAELAYNLLGRASHRRQVLGHRPLSSIEFFQINAFSSEQFWGNPAVVCPLSEWINDAAMQKIAAENNVTSAFFVGDNGRYDIRWFTPTGEINGICGHGTLAAGYVVLRELESATDEVAFLSAAGELRVRSAGDGGLVLDLPALPPEPCPLSPSQREALRQPVEATLGALDFIAARCRGTDQPATARCGRNRLWR